MLRKRKYFLTNSRGQHFSNTRKKHNKKIKLQCHEHRYDSLKQNFSISKPTLYKNQYIKWCFPQECKVDLTFLKSNQCNHYSDKLKKKVHLIISVDAKIAIDKNPTFISDKTSHQTKRNSLLNKGHFQKNKN